MRKAPRGCGRSCFERAPVEDEEMTLEEGSRGVVKSMRTGEERSRYLGPPSAARVARSRVCSSTRSCSSASGTRWPNVLGCTPTDMSDHEPATRPCPLCKEDVKPDAVRCKHCQGTTVAEPTHDGVCPYCKETINPAAIRCFHCKSNLDPRRRYFDPQRRRLLRSTVTARQETGPGVSYTRPVLRAETCPPAIIDSDPEGHGLGVWVLVEATNGECVYEYAGGIV